MDINIIISLITTLLVVGVVFILIPFTINKGWLQLSYLNQVKDLLPIAKVIKDVFTPQSNVIDIIYKITEVAVKAAEQTKEVGDNENKKQYAKEVTLLALKELNIEITDEIMAIVDASIESVVYTLPESHK
jgi:hypothetical protein